MTTLEDTQNSPAKIFVIDDDPVIRETLQAFYKGHHFDVQAFDRAQPALDLLIEGEKNRQPVCSLIVCDLKMPEMNGLIFLERLNEIFKRPPVLFLSGVDDGQTAVQALQNGAFDYINKPINFNELQVLTDRAIKIAALKEGYATLKKKLAKAWELEDMVGKSHSMQQVFDLVKRVAVSNCNSILITGENGTGKEMVARAIHACSSRASKPFVAINCAAIPEHLLESELFGHAKGAFTGAIEKRRGMIEEADGGTLLLDEIGDMPIHLQSKLLRILQERRVRLVGENTYRRIDIRIIAATHQQLPQSIKEGKFREDLFYRLCVVTIQLPALRERKEDIPLLAETFLKKYSPEGRMPAMTKGAIEKLMRYPWPGNVRELENAIQRALVFKNGDVVAEKDLILMAQAENNSIAEIFAGNLTLDQLERKYIEHVLTQVSGKKEKAAEILGIDRKTLYRKTKASETTKNEGLNAPFKDDLPQPETWNAF